MKEFVNFSINKRSYIYLLISIFAACFTCVSYLPFFVNGIGNKLMYIIWGAFLVFSSFLFVIKKKTLNSEIIFIIFLYSLILFFSFFQKVIFNTDIFSSRIFKSSSISFLILLAGFFCANLLEKNDFKIILKFYFICIVLLSFVVLFVYVLKSDLTGKEYGYQAGKNEISVLFFSAGVYFLFKDDKNNLLRIINTGIFLYFILVVALMRCRSVLLAFCIPIIYLFFKKDNYYKISKILIIVFCAVFLILVFSFEQLRDILFKSLISFGRDQADLDSFSTGRFGELANGLMAFSQNPLFGVGKFKVEMYYASALVQYGILFSIPQFLFIIYPVIIFINSKRNYKTFETSVLLVSAFAYLFLGFFEELMPIGPGVRTFLIWFFAGYFSADNKNIGIFPSKIGVFECVNI